MAKWNTTRFFQTATLPHDRMASHAGLCGLCITPSGGEKRSPGRWGARLHTYRVRDKENVDKKNNFIRRQLNYHRGGLRRHRLGSML